MSFDRAQRIYAESAVHNMLHGSALRRLQDLGVPWDGDLP